MPHSTHTETIVTKLRFLTTMSNFERAVVSATLLTLMSHFKSNFNLGTYFLGSNIEF